MMDEPLTFRPACEADLFGIVEMLADDPLGELREDLRAPLPEAYRAAFCAIESDPNQLLVVAERNGALVGTLQLSLLPGLARQGAWRGQIEAVRIARDHRGGKLGEAMFNWAIDECRARGCSLVQLTTDKARPDAHRFYDRLGFEPTHVGYKLKL
ncbi:GNAT family N-acetyltransferase [Maritimibacter sp. UBA3975]|uniref:GNAT family N-acetyltransferase n=1 Tax=Maritimibacter sp. UBA3975 TaxID=1946833 RepID=UPI000C090F8E|nr:GNAT family N-acetyltransferase [Maritimibacter sp. UBA3975]MAM62205.1 GNAT family N-acetyltransferase [Maritimibacter sp.]|tara:strand:- start:46765 stop:47229 length:465 start_codon:yes stop_codon:yes gene_type:complete